MLENIRAPKEIPFFDHRNSMVESIKNSSRHRGYSFAYFVYRKIKNILLYRMAYFCPLNSWRIKLHRWRGANIGKNVFIDKQCSLDNAFPEYIYIGDFVGVNQGTTILTHTNIRSHFDGLITPMVKRVVIKDYALIGINSTLLPGVIIGKSSIVSAGSVVSSNVKDYTLVQGNPAKKIIQYEHMLINKK
ncbi:MAG: acyltransferase [Bacteroidales bacterium]|nr:acyltransferase [Bacteroidales bacterium]